MIVLGIETSCDETAAAICQDKKIISSQISIQTIHRKYGGVVPEIASREHEKLLNNMVLDTLKDGGISKDQLKDKVLIRTRQYAKRQFTWQRGQMKDWKGFADLNYLDLRKKVISYLSKT